MTAAHEGLDMNDELITELAEPFWLKDAMKQGEFFDVNGFARALLSASKPAAPTLKPRMLAQLRRFNECCEDSETDGHDVDKDDMHSLAELGAVRPAPGGRHYMTDFGHYLLASPAAPAQSVEPVATDDFNGSTDNLIRSIMALLEMDAAGVLKPQGIGGHARKLLSASAARLLQLPKHEPAPGEPRRLVAQAAVKDDEQTACDAAYAKQSGNRRTDENDFGAGWEYAVEWMQARAASPQPASPNPMLDKAERDISATQVAAQPVEQADFPYQRTFNAIAAATSMSSSNAISISVRAFQEAYNAGAQPVEQTRACGHNYINGQCTKCGCISARE